MWRNSQCTREIVSKTINFHRSTENLNRNTSSFLVFRLERLSYVSRLRRIEIHKTEDFSNSNETWHFFQISCAGFRLLPNPLSGAVPHRPRPGPYSVCLAWYTNPPVSPALSFITDVKPIAKAARAPREAHSLPTWMTTHFIERPRATVSDSINSRTAHWQA